MTAIFGVMRWTGSGARSALDELVARWPRAHWHELDVAEVGGAAFAAVYPRTRIGLRAARAAGGGETVAAIAAGGEASPGIARLLGEEGRDGGHLGQRRILPIGYAAGRGRRGRLQLASDALGTHPLYIRRQPDGVSFASSALALALIEPASPLDPLAVAEILCLGQPTGTRTLFAGVEALPPGTSMTIQPGGETRNEWAWPRRERSGKSFGARAEALRRALTAAVASGCHPGTAGLLLSGGLDSRLLLAILTRLGQKVHGFTFGAEGCSDIRLAAAVSRALGTAHTVRPTAPGDLLDHVLHTIRLTDGMVSLLHFHGTEILPLMREAAETQWNGFAGDAILGGSFAHPRYRVPGPPSTATRVFQALNRVLPAAELPRVLAPAIAAEVAGHPEAAIGERAAAFGQASGEETALRLLMAERVGRLAAAGLAIDRYYLPVIAPYAHGPVVAGMLRLRPDDRRYSRILRAVLASESAALARIPWQQTGLPPVAPWPLAAAAQAAARIAARCGRRDRGLIDYRAWLDGPLRPLREHLVRALCDQPLFDAERIAALATAPVRTPGEVALAGVLMTLGAVVMMLDGRLDAGAKAAKGTVI